jgi:hypothetical protein
MISKLCASLLYSSESGSNLANRAPEGKQHSMGKKKVSNNKKQEQQQAL